MEGIGELLDPVPMVAAVGSGVSPQQTHLGGRPGILSPRDVDIHSPIHDIV